MTATTRPLGVQISAALKARGVDVIFGIPGVHNVELYRGIEEAGITHVLTRHEQGAGFMADGYARATGKPGVAYVITGPGLCNVMTPMGQAYSDSVPVLVVSSCLEREHRGMARGRLHEMLDQEAAAATVCEWSLTAPDARGAFALIDRAFAEFAVARPRSKHIQVPIDVLGLAADPAPSPRVAPARPVVPRTAVRRVAEDLRAAKRPLIILGGGAAGGTAAARSVVDRTGAAVFSTYAGRGIISSDHPLNFGATLARPDSAGVIAQADLVLAVGTHLAEVDLWRDALGHRAPLVRVDIDPSVLADWHQADKPHLGDAPTFLAELAEELGDAGQATTWDASEIRRQKAAWRAEADAARPGIVPVCDALRGSLPAGTMIYSDMTQFAYVAKEVWPLDAPGLWHHPTGFGTLGYALPAAIGGKIGRGDEPVVAIAGDYGFQYTVQELGVAVELGLSLPIILWDNGKLKEIEEAMIASQIAPNAVVARNPDFVALAQAWGATGVRPDSLSALQDAVRAALTRQGPTLIHVTAGIA
jgi:5-guanidino-2-oxopentanoate decarboxylase